MGDIIPVGFWGNEGGPWYWSAQSGVHSAEAHATCEPVHDEYGSTCHMIGEQN